MEKQTSWNEEHKPLFREICIAQGGIEMSMKIAKELETLFIEMGISTARKIVMQVTRQDFPPKNIVGAIRNRWDELKSNSKNEYDRSKYYVPPEERATPEDIAKLRKQIDEMCNKFAIRI